MLYVFNFAVLPNLKKSCYLAMYFAIFTTYLHLCSMYILPDYFDTKRDKYGIFANMLHTAICSKLNSRLT